MIRPLVSEEVPGISVRYYAVETLRIGFTVPRCNAIKCASLVDRHGVNKVCFTTILAIRKIWFFRSFYERLTQLVKLISSFV
jgi:hypothetical protein